MGISFLKLIILREFCMLNMLLIFIVRLFNSSIKLLQSIMPYTMVNITVLDIINNSIFQKLFRVRHLPYMAKKRSFNFKS